MKKILNYKIIKIIFCNDIYVLYKVSDKTFFYMKEFYNFRYFCIDLCMLKSLRGDYFANVIDYFRINNKFFIILEYYEKFNNNIHGFINKMLNIGYFFELNGICYNNFNINQIYINKNDPILIDFTLSHFSDNNINDVINMGMLFRNIFNNKIKEVELLIDAMITGYFTFNECIYCYNSTINDNMQFIYNDIGNNIDEELHKIILENLLSCNTFVISNSIKDKTQKKYNNNDIIILSCLLGNDKIADINFNIDNIISIMRDFNCNCFPQLVHKLKDNYNKKYIFLKYHKKLYI